MTLKTLSAILNLIAFITLLFSVLSKETWRTSDVSEQRLRQMS